MFYSGGLQQLRKINILSASVPETLAKRSEGPYLNFIILNQVIIAHFIATGRADRWIALSGFLQCYLFLLGHYLRQELWYFIAAVEKKGAANSAHSETLAILSEGEKKNPVHILAFEGIIHFNDMWEGGKESKIHIMSQEL